MMNKLLQQINLRRYLPFFAPCSEKNYALAIYNKFGTRQLLESSESAGQIIKILQSIHNQNYDWDNVNTENISYPLGKQGYLHFVPLIIGAREEHYWLAGIQQTEEYITPQQQVRNNGNLSHIAQCLQEDYTLTDTLNGMADELAVRYEELNMLYGIDETDSYYKNRDEQESLAQLLSNCIDYLNIDLTILYLPELEISLHQAGSLTEMDHELLIKIVYQQVFPYMAKHQETLVINRNQDYDWTDADLKIP